ncbi:MAG: c-type cytochrome biogenesis protein CcmI, partial [Sutterellaceae bacterium]|nr:c-type cytochrome biogenesis protein CcmI [Sutterellaceae bacterium]
MAAAFIAVAVVLCALVILFLALGLRSRKGGGDAAEKARIRTNIEELRANYAELVAGHAAGRVSDEEFAETRAELERRVLDESRAGETLEASDRKQRLGTIAFVAVFVPVAAALFYWRYGTWDA